MTIGGEKGQHQHYEQNFFLRFRTRQTRNKTNSFRGVDQNSTIHVSSLSLSLFSRPKKSNDNKHKHNNNDNSLCNSSYQWPMPVTCVIIRIIRITLKVSDWMNFRSIRERRKKEEENCICVPPQILHSSLAAFWYGACPAFIMPPVCIGSSLHLPIFYYVYEWCFFSLKGRERID